MSRKRLSPRLGRALAGLILAVFILVFLGSVCHFGCCHGHDEAESPCPVCVMLSRYHQLLRLAGLLLVAAAGLTALRAAGVKGLFRLRREAAPITLVDLRVKLSN